MTPQVSTTRDPVASVGSDVVVVGCFSNGESASLSDQGTAIDATLDGTLGEYLAAISFKGKVGEVLVSPTLGRLPSRAVAVAGLGPREKATTTEIRRAAGAVARRLGEHTEVACGLHLAVPAPGAACAAAEGMVLGTYRFTTHKSDPHPSKIQRIVFVDAEPGEVERGVVGAEATNLARDLVNEPGGTLPPRVLAERAREVADVGGLDCEILDEATLGAAGFGGILGVSQGAEEPPRLIVLRYRPEGEPAGRVALVGKGITFDSGGYSIKTAAAMETMKTDMSGAAAVIAAMGSLTRLSVRLEVIGIVPSSENLVSGRALKPGDVIRHYGGTTSEVNNTDAEGRLILADALGYACEQQPDAIVDLATLTGGVQIALGRKVSGLFANDDGLAREVEQAAHSAGELVWRLPLYEPYRSSLDSEVADIKNSGGRDASPILGALYLKDFVKKDIPWAHLDIAGTARSESAAEEIPRGGTGVATRTLLEWVQGRSR